MRLSGALAAALLATACSREPERRPTTAPQPQQTKPRPNPYGPEFDAQWNDGKAEVANYSLVMPDRSKGQATSITVAELFSFSGRVTVKGNSRGGSDVFPALKFNAIRRYRTGVEDRSTMLSVVIALTELNGIPSGAATDVSLSRQGWSGHSWRSLLFTKDRALIVEHDQRTRDSRRYVSYRQMRLAEDALPLVARRIGWPRLKLGQRCRANVLSSLESDGDPQVSSVWLALPPDRETVDTPAGSFRCHRFTATWPNGRTKTWLVQGDPPYRIVRWQFSDGERGDLLSADRAVLTVSEPGADRSPPRARR